MRILRMKDLTAKVGLNKVTIYQMMAKGKFPKSFKITEGASGWREDVIDNWIEERSKIPAEAER